MLSTVLPSIGIGALSAREAEGRTISSAGEKVLIYDILIFSNYMFFHLSFYLEILQSAKLYYLSTSFVLTSNRIILCVCESLSSPGGT